MKQVTGLVVAACASLALSLNAFGGSESLASGKEMKQVAPAPVPECNWTGFYIGLNVGGQWGHSEDLDEDGYQAPAPHEWGYDESGVVAGGQIGYNFQWNWVVLGVEADAGYMNLEGRGTSDFDANFLNSDTHGSTDSDFFTTIRGRLGLAWGHWLFYGTGGGIGVNLKTRVVDDCNVFPCGFDLIDAGKTDFNWGWTGGGGIEYMLACHWTLRGEYLRYQLDDKSFDAISARGFGPWHFTAIGTEGNVFRAALNYKF